MGDRGRCPECGGEFNVRDHTGIRLPHSPIEKSQRLYARVRTVMLAGVGGVLIAIAIYAQYVLSFPRALYTAGFFGLLRLMGAWFSYVSQSQD